MIFLSHWTARISNADLREKSNNKLLESS